MHRVDGLRVIGAAFEDARTATRVLSELRGRFALAPHDVDVAPMGTNDREEYVTLVAGRFPVAIVNEVRRVVHDRGGRIVVDLEEWMTRPVEGSGPSSNQTPRSTYRQN